MSEKKRKASPVEGTSISPVGVDHAEMGADRTVEIPVPGKLFAKKNFEIHHNGYDRKIKVGEDLSDVPELYHPNLRAEGVL